MKPPKKNKTDPKEFKETEFTTSENKFHSLDDSFPIVGIGASAGGLEALELFFGNMPENTGMAFVVVQHLDPTHIGILPELLQRITPMKVLQITDQMKVIPNCIYVIPPNKILSILNGVLLLFDLVESHGPRLPIDRFFKSLADDQGQNSIGIILSGMGSDGSKGAKDIIEKKGKILIQDPNSAKFNGMPESATEAVNADIIAHAEDLPARLIACLKYIPGINSIPVIESKTRNSIDKIITLLREQTDHDFSLYKKNTLLRRIERRKEIHQIDKLHSYVRFLQENPKEIEILFKELLIGVTSFFRDSEVWKKLKDSVLPALIQELPEGYVLRAWVAGCSTGEEAFSIAIIFKEIIEKSRKKKNITLQIFATDLDVDAIDKARKGFFNASISEQVSQERLSKYFISEENGYRINSTIREMVVFAPQNVIKDPPFTRLDLLTCRNLLIYMEPELQKKLMALFNYSLNPKGILVLGTAETMGSYMIGFKELDAKSKIFKRITSYQSAELLDFPSSFHRRQSAATIKKMTPKNIENIRTLADQILLQRFAPASVLVNNTGDILYITGRTGKYLEPVAGKANWNIYAMAREGLRQELPVLLRKAMTSYDMITLRNVKIGTNGGTQYVDLTVQQIENPPAIRGTIMVVFTDVTNEIEHTANESKGKNKNTDTRYAELEFELKRSYEELRSLREQMQTSQEELKSTNEELQSTNEELQSTNEELTTSKEEMQSLNEELHTVNHELQSKVIEYVTANDDMKNLLNSTEIATLFLDKELNIRRFTDPVIKIFKLRSSDIGRPFTDLVTNLHYPEMEKHAQHVIKTLVSTEAAITTNDGSWFNVRIMPYRTVDDRIDGLVITFSDITIAKKLEFALKKANETLIKNSLINENEPLI
jgi:two-component system CheB/CheR fusion protein